jgi:tetratricopeptide (TPR) repeat protein
MNKKRYILEFGFVVLVSVILLTQTSVAAFKNVSEGSTAPNITLKDINGDDFSFEDVYNNKNVVMLVFWATWSPRSVKELVDLQEMYDSYKEKGIDIVAVNVEDEEITKEDIEKIKSVVKENKISFNVIIDDRLSTFYSYGAVAIPSSAIIKKGGEILKDYASYATFAYEDIKDNIEYELGIKERPKEVEVAKEDKKYKPIKAALLHFGLGKKLIARGMPDKAMKEFKISSEIDEKFDMPHVLLGELYYKKAMIKKNKSKKARYIEDAKTEYLKAIELDSDNLSALSGLALAFIENKNEEKAQEHLEKVLDMEPNFTPALNAMGVLYKNKGEKDKAVENFNAALELNPNQPEIIYLKALTYKEAGENKKAIASFKKAFKLLIKKVTLAMMQEKK